MRISVKFWSKTDVERSFGDDADFVGYTSVTSVTYISVTKLDL